MPSVNAVFAANMNKKCFHTRQNTKRLKITQQILQDFNNQIAMFFRNYMNYINLWEAEDFFHPVIIHILQLAFMVL